MKEKPSTGNATVDAIGQIEHMFIGPLAPYPWFTKILDERGRPYHLAILLLAEIVGWYRPRRELAKGSNALVAHKRFKRDRLQISRGELAKKFNTDEDTITKALNFLEYRVGAIVRHKLDLVVQGHKYRNCLFIWPVPEVIEKLCEVDEPEDESGPKEPAGVAPITGATWPPSHRPHTPDDAGDVVACKEPRGPGDPGDVAPTMGVGTVTGREADRKSTTTTNGRAHGADAPVVVADRFLPGANPVAPAANAPAAQGAKPTRKQKAATPAKGALRQTARQIPDSDADGAVAASVEAGAAEGDNDPVEANADRFLEFFRMAHKSKFGTTAKVTDADRVAIRNLIRQDDWLVSDLVLVALRAWEKIGKTANDGKYKYGCCQNSRQINKFVEHFDRICTDTESGNIRDLPVQMVVGQIARLTGFDPDEVEQFFAPELEREGAAEAEPELKLEDLPDPKDTNVRSYVRDNPNIPFTWIEQKLIPHLAESKGGLPPGKLEFLCGYWKLWRKYEDRHPKDIEADYTEMRDYKSRQCEDEGVRARLLAIVETMLKTYRRWKQHEAGQSPTWPILRNVLGDKSVKEILQPDERHTCK